MEIDFNNIRKEAIMAYERLVKKLNSSIQTMDGPDEFIMPNYNPQQAEKLFYPNIAIRVSDIKKDMDDLRRTIGLIGLTHDEKHPEIKDVFSEVFPGKWDTMTHFESQEK